MVRAGADRTMSPYGIGGRRLAMMTLKPLVVDFIDTTLDRNEFTLEGVKVIKGSSIESISVKESIKRVNGGHILAIKKKTGLLVTNPHTDTIIEAGDELVIMGTRDQLKGIEDFT